jgi:cysteine desulfurase
VGLLYINENVRIHPYIHGGAQERNMRAGTENVYGIVGFARALELATDGFEADSAYIKGLKVYMMEQLKRGVRGISFKKSVYGTQCIVSQNREV